MVDASGLVPAETGSGMVGGTGQGALRTDETVDMLSGRREVRTGEATTTPGADVEIKGIPISSGGTSVRTGFVLYGKMDGGVIKT